MNFLKLLSIRKFETCTSTVNACVAIMLQLYVFAGERKSNANGRCGRFFSAGFRPSRIAQVRYGLVCKAYARSANRICRQIRIHDETRGHRRPVLYAIWPRAIRTSDRIIVNRKRDLFTRFLYATSLLIRSNV